MRVASFFYGSYMDPEVLRRFGAEPDDAVPARLSGYRLAFTPHANLVLEPGSEAQGFVFEMTHEELDHLYGPNGFVTTYRPVPVMVETPTGRRPAMTYIEDAPESPPEGAYLDAFLAICRRLGLPEDYVAGVEDSARTILTA